MNNFATLVLWTGSDLFLTIQSREGVTQGDPLAMVTYGVGLLPLIHIVITAVSNVHQPWCADDAGAGGHFHRIKPYYFEKFQEYGPLVRFS